MKALPLRRVAGTLLKLLPLLVVVLLVARQRFIVPVPARTAPVEKGDVVREVFGRGTVESRREVELGFDVVGRIADILVDEGDRVKLGQVVAHLAPETFAADVKSASSGVAVAKAAIARLEAEERRAVAALDFAKSEVDRMRALSQSGSVSARDFDLAEQQHSLARAEVDRVRAAHAEADRQISLASGTVEVRSVAAARAVLVSPFDGLVIRRLRDPGDTVTVGTTVLRVVATDVLWSRAWIDEGALPALREKQPAHVRFGAEGPPGGAGHVDRIGREVDRQTHELLVDVLLEKPPSRVAIGQRADVWIEVDRRRDVTRIPLAFLRRDPAGAHCYVDRGGRVARAPVSLGLVGTEHVEITAGLAPGDVVLDAVDPGAALPVGRRFRRGEP
jgi:HlyD family secretion protein